MGLVIEKILCMLSHYTFVYLLSIESILQFWATDTGGIGQDLMNQVDDDWVDLLCGLVIKKFLI